MSRLSPADGTLEAVAAIARFPLRWCSTDEAPSDPAEVAARGWFRGAPECARYLAGLTRAAIEPARAFGGEWPMLASDNWLMTPAAPVALTGSGGEGVDAFYSRRDGAVYREAAGWEKLFLAPADRDGAPGRPFELLWFGDSERFTVSRGMLEIEDLFAVLEAPAERAWVEGLLVRGRRVDPQVLDGLTWGALEAPAKLTVNRASSLERDVNWSDPERYLRARADVERTERRGAGIVVHSATGNNLYFQVAALDDGWTLELDGGDYPITGFSMRRLGTTLSLTARLHPSVDPLRPGMRTRLAFDLRSDLVALG